MNNFVGENISNLRHQRDITQEELAEYLNISFQTISKWERGENLPDIHRVVALANYFDVSTDELLGIDKQRSAMFANDFFPEVNRLIREEEYGEAIEKLRSAKKVYSNNIGINSSLAMALALRDEPLDGEEAAGLCRQVLGEVQDEKVRTSTRTVMFIISKNTMEKQEALLQAKRLTHVWDCREMITAELYDGSERKAYIERLIRLVVTMLYQKTQQGKMSDKELLKTTFVGPQDVPQDNDTTLKMLEAIKGFLLG